MVTIEPFLNIKKTANPNKLKQMAQKAKTFYNPKTPELIKAEILKFKPKS